MQTKRIRKQHPPSLEHPLLLLFLSLLLLYPWPPSSPSLQSQLPPTPSILFEQYWLPAKKMALSLHLASFCPPNLTRIFDRCSYLISSLLEDQLLFQNVT